MTVCSNYHPLFFIFLACDKQCFSTILFKKKQYFSDSATISYCINISINVSCRLSKYAKLLYLWTLKGWYMQNNPHPPTFVNSLSVSIGQDSVEIRVLKKLDFKGNNFKQTLIPVVNFVDLMWVLKTGWMHTMLLFLIFGPATPLKTQQKCHTSL